MTIRGRDSTSAAMALTGMGVEHTKWDGWNMARTTGISGRLALCADTLLQGFCLSSGSGDALLNVGLVG